MYTEKRTPDRSDSDPVFLIGCLELMLTVSRPSTSTTSQVENKLPQDRKMESFVSTSQEEILLPSEEKTEGMKEVSRAAPERKRTYHIKTKTGCVTCKFRRLKCDETKPQCLRCLRWSGKCEGYHATKKKRSQEAEERKSGAITARKLVPLAQKHDSSPAYSFDDGLKFRNEQEYNCYSAFRAMSKSTACPYYAISNTSLWDSISQGCHTDDCIRDAVIALGALLTCQRKLAKDANDRVVRSPYESSPRYQFALKQYGAAIKKMGTKVSYEEPALRSLLMGCILVICFEACMGNHVKALNHAIGGHTILRSWLTSKRQATVDTSENKEMASPSEHIIEDELVQAFSRLDMQVVMYTIDSRPTEVHKELHLEGSGTINDMPPSFSSLPEARKYLDLVQRRAWHFILMLEDEDYHKQGTKKVAMPPYKGLGFVSLRRWKDIPGMSDEYLMHASEILRWQSAFHSLLEFYPRASNYRKAATILQIQAESTKIGLYSLLNKCECDWDAFIPDFQRVIALAKEAYDDAFLKTWHGFAYDGGVIKPLWMVASYCREPVTRREAIDLMRKVAAKELFWDALLHASASEMQMYSEEEGMDENGFIPETERFRVARGSLDDLRRTGTVTFRKVGMKKDGSVDERTFSSTV